MRPAGRMRLGFYPLPLAEARRIRSLLTFPNAPCCALDPCVGDGAAFAEVSRGQRVLRYGVELDTGRAEEARAKGIEMVHGNCFDVQCPAESFSLIYLNPPYDFELAESNSERVEKRFVQQAFRWLKRTGVLLLVVPVKSVANCAVPLSGHFRDLRAYRLTDRDCARYRQVLVAGVRLTRQERDRLQDRQIIESQLWLGSLQGEYERIDPLPAIPTPTYNIPEGAPVRIVDRGLPLDTLEDLLPGSSAYRRASAVLFGNQREISGRPLTPLHGGHVGLLCTAGMLNGIFGDGDLRHIANWHSIKLVDKSEGQEEGQIIIRERERFSNELTLVFSTGEVATLK